MTDAARYRATVAGDPSLVVELATEDAAADDVRRTWVAALPATVTDRAEGRTRLEVVVDGWRFEVTVETAQLARLRDRARRAADETRPHAREHVRAQIPGRIVMVRVARGDTVAAGDALLSIEAMKMENEVRATRPGTIATVAVEPGDRVELGDELVVVE